MKHNINRIHFVGIGGSGMSGIAEVMHNLGYNISGSDIQESPVISRLKEFGIKIFINHSADNIKDVDVIVFSSAIDKDNPELKAAIKNKIPMMPRAEMLSELMRFKKGIAVAGTHGKTTTTSLIASILAEASMDPTYVIGGRLSSLNANAKLGNGEYIVVEADESDASFLHLTPVYSIVTNIDQDHMEAYDNDFDKLKKTYIEFIHRLPFYGVVILCIDDPVIQSIIPEISRPIITYGLSKNADVHAEEVRADAGKMHFKVTIKHSDVVKQDITLNLPGKHYVRNALAAIALADELEIPILKTIDALKHFKGVGRRFETYKDLTFNAKAFTLVDDYGHHPVEIEAVLDAARDAYPKKSIYLVFQPHRYTRTRDFFNEFVRVLHKADKVLLTDIYSAGEKMIPGVSALAMMEGINKITDKVFFEKDISYLAKIALQHIDQDSILIVMGAGSIGTVTKDILNIVNS
ncbi:MAG: UDP-N-acetylmuramate--L-alanine ligase [Candidatus Methylopumilus sp.]|nr:UDP-N-acetylmuramate--L-alanine ligase [Candidatus Methylopumilus sp.]